MGRLAGPDGRVTGIEVDPDLAARAAGNLADRAGTTVLAGDGARTGFAPADVVFVNAGAVRPADLWLHRRQPEAGDDVWLDGGGWCPTKG